METKNCPACLSEDTRPAFLKEEYRYFRCRSCGSLYTSPGLPEADVLGCYSESYYESEALNDGKRKGYPSYKKGYETLTDGFRNKLALVERFRRGGDLLDAGAAYGYFLKILPETFRGVGLEASAYAARVAGETSGVKVVCGDITQTPFEARSFDVVTMWDIIEHLVRPRDALREAFRLLRPGGRLFVGTDDAANWLPRLLGSRWWALGAPLHLCHFSKAGLGFAAVSAGFEPPSFFPDRRKYSLPEIIKHFGVSYQNKALRRAGDFLNSMGGGKLVISVTRPEQFTAVLRKPEAAEA